MEHPISPEQLITELTYENRKLKADLLETKRNLEDFEVFAIEWKDNYNKREHQLKVQIKHLEQTIEELEKELKE